jgi:glycosyltransferase involved in cell wall biosynthesis
MIIDRSISVIIPTHNRCVQLSRAIDSVIAQGVADLEIIVVDDASTDATSEMDFAALDGRITVLRHDRNRGGAAARNTGIAYANGSWVAFLDSDDTWLPGKLQRQREAIERLGAGNYFLCANVLSRTEDGRESLFNSRPPVINENLSEYFLIRGNSFQTSALMVPAQALRHVRFDESLKRHQDWDLVLRLVRAGYRYEYSHEPLAVYSNASDGTRISRQRDPAPTLHWFRVARDLVSPAAAAYLYSYLYLPRHLRTSFAEALGVLSALAVRDSRAFGYACQAITRRAREEVHRVVVNR